MYGFDVCLRGMSCVAEGRYPGDGVEEQLRKAGQVDRAVHPLGRRPDEDRVSALLPYLHRDSTAVGGNGEAIFTCRVLSESR